MIPGMYNRVRIQRYQKEIVSDEMRAKIKDYDRKKAAAYRLKKKLESEKIKEANNTRKRKSRQSKEIPTDVKQFKKLVTKICKVGIKSEAMNEILVNSLSVAQRTNKSKPLSVLQLQSLKAKNQKKEHGELVAKIKTTYGSL